MIVSLSYGRWLALGGLLTIFVIASNPALAQTQKKPASSTAAAKAKKKPAVRAKKPVEPEPGDDLSAEEKALEDKPKNKKQTRAQKAKAEKEKKAKEKEAKAEKAKAEKEKKAEKAKAAKAKGKGKGKGKGKEKAPPPEEARIVVLPFDGPNGKRLRGYVVSSLSKVEGVSDVTEENSKRENSADAAIALANEQQASAVVYGTASRKRGQIVLDVVMRGGTDGQVLGEATFRGPNVQKVKQRVDNDLPIELAEAIEKAKPIPEAEPEPEPPPEEEEAVAAEEEEREEQPEEEAPAAAAKGRPSPLEVWLGLRGFDRDFSYNEDIAEFDDGAAEQSTYGGPGIAGFLSLRWYPVAHVKGGFLAHLGLQGGYERGFLTRAKSPTGRELDVTYQEFFIGLRGRIPIARHELGVSASYGQHEFTVQDDETLLPDVKYGYLRPAVDGRFRFGKGLAGFSLGYRNVLSAGQIQDDDWYPNSDVGGVDLGLFGGYTPTGSYDLMAGVDMRRYFYTLNPEPGDARIAGGAVDQYLGVWLGVAWHLAGSKD